MVREISYPSSFYSHLPAYEDGTDCSETSESQTFSRTISYPSSFYSHLPAYEDGTVCSETSAYKLQTPGNYPKESIQHTEHGESLKSRSLYTFTTDSIYVTLEHLETLTLQV